MDRFVKLSVAVIGDPPPKACVPPRGSSIISSRLRALRPKFLQLHMPNEALVPVYPHYVPPGWQLLLVAMCEVPSASCVELSKMTGVNAQTIRNWRKKPEFASYQQWYLETHYASHGAPVISQVVSSTPSTFRQRKELKEEISDFARESFDRLCEIMETTDDEKLQVNIAQDMMDRAGFQASRKVEVHKQAMILTPELLETLNRRAAEAKQAPIVEAEVVK